MTSVIVPAWLKSNETKKKELFEHLQKNHTPLNELVKDQRVFLFYSHNDDTKDAIDSTSENFIAATVIRADGSDSVLKFDTGNKWHLYSNSTVVSVDVYIEYVAKHSATMSMLDTSRLDKLVLEPSAKQEIVNVLKQHTHMQKIFKEWGLDEVMEYGKAMSLLFYGPPGTGKTWGATCIANALGKELLVISAAEIQTSEPGGANRNIVAAFEQAKMQDNVLFLDECDGLITDRSQVGMILASEINTLLTCLEKFEGVVIFATNRADTLDPAMARRVSLMVEFKEPTATERKDIWNVLLPKKMPLAKDVSLAKLAKFELTGGYIKNAVLNAARTAAAEEADAVSMKHFASAIKRIKASKDILGTHTSRQQDFIKARN